MGYRWRRKVLREGKGEEKRTKGSANHDEDTLQHGVGAQGFHGLYGYSNIGATRLLDIAMLALTFRWEICPL